MTIPYNVGAKYTTYLLYLYELPRDNKIGNNIYMEAGRITFRACFHAQNVLFYEKLFVSGLNVVFSLTKSAIKVSVFMHTFIADSFTTFSTHGLLCI